MEEEKVVPVIETDGVTQERELSGSTQEQKPKPGPQVTFMGNSYDLTALGTLVCSLIVLFMCLSCGSGLYCLPVAPILLGIFGLIMAKDSVNVGRTRLLSWIGVGTGSFFVLLIALGILLYVLYLVFLAYLFFQVEGLSV